MLGQEPDQSTHICCNRTWDTPGPSTLHSGSVTTADRVQPRNTRVQGQHSHVHPDAARPTTSYPPNGGPLRSDTATWVDGRPCHLQVEGGGVRGLGKAGALSQVTKLDRDPFPLKPKSSSLSQPAISCPRGTQKASQTRAAPGQAHRGH